MPKFSYIAVTKAGKREVSTIEAASQDEAIAALQKKGLVVSSIVQFGGAAAVSGEEKKRVSFGLRAHRRFKHRRVSSGDLVIFARQLNVLLGAGVSLMKTLEVISKQVDSQKLYEVICEIMKQMEAGQTFKDALAKFKNVFSDLWLYLVETGEASGNLPTVLEHLANYLENKAAFKRKIISALMYPCILFVVAIGAILFFVIKIVPTFTSILGSMNVAMPKPTLILIALSNILREKFVLIIVAIVAFIFLFKRFMKNEGFGFMVEKFQLQVPLLGNFLRFIMIESFATTMSILIESGVPIIYALDISERSQPSRTMREIINSVKMSVREGVTFAVPLEKSNFFPPMVVQMISTGEEIGELSNMFKRIAKYYQDYLEAFVTRFAALFEPLMILFMGGIIGAMVISIFLPIFNLATASGH